MMLFLKFTISAAVIVAVSEIAKRNNAAAAVIHSLPLVSLMTFCWLYIEQKDTKLIASHSFGTFWYVLPTLPMFLVLPVLLRNGMGFWLSLGLCITGTFGLYVLTMKLLDWFGVKL